MPSTGTSGSVGGLGGQTPRSTRPIFVPKNDTIFRPGVSPGRPAQQEVEGQWQHSRTGLSAVPTQPESSAS